MASKTANNIRINPKNRCRICLETTNGKIVLNQTIVYKEAEISMGDLLMFCLDEQVDENGKADGLCVDCVEKGIVYYEFKKLFEASRKILLKEIEDENAFELNTEEVIQENEIKDEILEKKQNTKNHVVLYGTHRQEHSSITPTILYKQYEIDEDNCELCAKGGKIFRYKRKQSCFYCSYIPQSSAALTNHLKNVHKEITADGSQIPCPTCDKIFYDTTRLNLHMLIHAGIKNHMCEYCGKSFTLVCNMVRHRRIHTGEKPYTFAECGRGFAQQATLKSHQTMHSNQRNYVCQQCGAAFARRESLSKHKKIHDAVRPHKCTLCNKAFRFRTGLKKHVVIHTGVQNYACEFCGKRFNRSSNLNVHRKIHTGETPHTCQICGKGFIQAHCLKTHMNTHPK